jgi:shikimate dehydrogenase
MAEKLKLKLALIGRDVSNSESEPIHKFILNKLGAECAYEKVSVSEEGFDAAVDRLLSECDGFNVTIPYKGSIIDHLTFLSPAATEFGAVNTVLCKDKAGYNTDGIGFMRMLCGAGISLKGKTALVLGGGGAGRSVVTVLKTEGAQVYLYQRNRHSLMETSEKLGVGAAERTDGFLCDLLINCTGVGMHESIGRSPVGRETIKGCGAAIDLIYRPSESEFLRLARTNGKKTLNGHAMLFHQAYYSDCLYLGRTAFGEESDELYQQYKRYIGI